MPIQSIEELRSHLRLAIKVELSTIPPYLFAMYSIVDQASDAAKLIRSVATEEMLHAALVANVLVAVGGEPRFYDEEAVPSYPCPLPHHIPELLLDLAPCSPALIRETFLVIEQPAAHEAPSEPDQFETLGQFYHAIEEGLAALDADQQLFAHPAVDRQLGPSHYAPVKFDADDSGGLLVIDSLTTALEALEIVVHQGEGLADERWADPGHQELTHYYKFLSLADGTTPIGDIYQAISNPTLGDLPSGVEPVARLFNATYSYLLLLMDKAYQPMPADERDPVVGLMYGAMEALMRPLARHLFCLDTERGPAGPTFEFHAFADPATASEELRELGQEVVALHPDLAPVVAQLARF